MLSRFNKLLIVSFIFIAGFAIFFPAEKENDSQPSKAVISEITEEPAVLGDKTPRIYISRGSNYSYASGGVIPLASTDEPSVFIDGYGYTGEADVTLFESNENALIDYLIHDDKNNQTKTPPDTSKLKQVVNLKHKKTKK